MDARKGQATLSFIILISGLILEVAVAGSFITYFLSTSGLGERLSARALSVASSGIRDAQMRLTRMGILCVNLNTYTITLGQDAATVSMVRVSGSESCEYTITSIGVAGTRQRKLVAVLLINKATGLSELRSISEQPVGN